VRLNKKAVASAPQPKLHKAKTVQRSVGALREGKRPAKTGEVYHGVLIMFMQCAPFFRISFIRAEFTLLTSKVSRLIQRIISLIRRIASLIHRIASLISRIASLIRRIASLIIKFMIQTWKIMGSKPEKVRFPDQSSLDEITRQLPDGFYSTFRTYDLCTRVIGLARHLRRLPAVDASSLRRNLRQLLEPYRPGETRVRVMETKHKEVFISIEPLRPLPAEVYENGVRVETTSIQRIDPRVKSTTFISVSNAERNHIAQAGIFEALLVKDGKILEGMTSNFFYILRAERGILYTAQKNILLGVTRTMVIRAALGRGVEVRYRAMEMSQLRTVKEAFITSSSRGIVPVIQIDDVRVGQGRVGRVTKDLMHAYAEYVNRRAEKI
jgi:branched-chain amino acid aminotransferase